MQNTYSNPFTTPRKTWPAVMLSIFTKLTIARQIFVKNYRTEFHGNRTGGLDVDTRRENVVS